MTDSITCPRCGRTSYHPDDIAHGYCGWCKWPTSDRYWGQPAAIAMAEEQGAIRSLVHEAPRIPTLAVPLRNRLALALVMSAITTVAAWPNWIIGACVTVVLFALVIFGWRRG